ncbi:MAG: hypothetical protein H7Y31_07465 [Chitinophagaceae bacterium]|nr:hypothetical protein [Chitinophagaceae bacterium]
MVKRLLVLSLISVFLLSACSKDDDTPPVPVETPEQLLVKAAWKVEEIRYMQTNSNGGGADYYYKRGVTGNVSNLDNESVRFDANGVGSYTVGATTSPIVWQFSNADKTRLTWTINYSGQPAMTVNWENIVISATSLRYAEYFTTVVGGVTVKSLGSVTRIH